MLESLQQSLDDTSRDFIRSLAQVYEAQAAQLMAEIVAAADHAQLRRLREAAHSLKGSSATLGGTRLAALCEGLEHWEGPTADVRSKVAEVQAEQGAFSIELRQYLEE